MNTIALPTTAVSPLLTADEFFARHLHDRVELIHGVVKEIPMPGANHGYICSEVSGHLREHVKKHDLGRVMSNDTFVQVSSDTVFGADVYFISYQRLPKGKLPSGRIDAIPELVVEVRSPSDAWTELFAKVQEYLDAGVLVVILINPEREAIGVYRPGMLEEQFASDQHLTLPDLLPGFSLHVRELFQ